MDWSHGLEYCIGVKCWRERETVILVVKLSCLNALHSAACSKFMHYPYIHVNHGKFMVNLCYTSVTHSVYAFISTHFVLCSPKANCVPPEMSFSVPGLKI